MQALADAEGDRRRLQQEVVAEMLASADVCRQLRRASAETSKRRLALLGASASACARRRRSG
jgi:hypothetical protein